MDIICTNDTEYKFQLGFIKSKYIYSMDMGYPTITTCDICANSDLHYLPKCNVCVLYILQSRLWTPAQFGIFLLDSGVWIPGYPGMPSMPSPRQGFMLSCNGNK